MAIQIRADANRMRDVLLNAAEGRAKEIRGQGDADAARYYEMLEADPSLAIFLANLETLKVISPRSTVVIPMDSDPYRLLKEMPSLGTEGSAK